MFVEYAKDGPEDILVRITVCNRGPDAARLRVLPTLWFRNTWSWGDDGPKPSLRAAAPGVVRAVHPELGDYWLSCDGAPELLFTENESNAERLWGQPNPSPYVKDAFHDYIVGAGSDAVNPGQVGHQGRGALRARRAGAGAAGSSACGCRPRGRPTPFDGFDQIVRQPNRRTPTSSTSGSRRRR